MKKINDGAYGVMTSSRVIRMEIKKEVAERKAYVRKHGESEYTYCWGRYINFLREDLIAAKKCEESVEEENMH